MDIKYYIENIPKKITHNMKTQTIAPWNGKLVKVPTSVNDIGDERKAEFHTSVTKSMFLYNRERPNIEPAVRFLLTRNRSFQ